MYKIALIGDCGVGKTCLTERYTRNVFEVSSNPTIAVDYESFVFEHNGRNYKHLGHGIFHNSSLFDLKGWTRTGLASQYIRNCHGIVYDLTNQNSFVQLSKWFEFIEKNKEVMTSNLILLLGNKRDAEDKREVNYENGEKLLEERENLIMFEEVSAKTGENVKRVFDKFFRQIIDENPLERKLDENVVELFKKEGLDVSKQKGCGCMASND